MVKYVYVSPRYVLLKSYLDKLNKEQSGGKPPVLYPDVNSGLEKKLEIK